MIWIYIVAGIASLYVGGVIVSSWMKVKTAPKEPMYICPVHGAIPKSGIIKWEMFETETCAICFHEKLKKAESLKYL